jgi:hypothetical protein
MELILLFVGFFIGLAVASFATANMVYPILVALPILASWKRERLIFRIPYARVLATPVIWIVLSLGILALMSAAPASLQTGSFIGSVFALIGVLSKTRSQANRADTTEAYGYLIEEKRAVEERRGAIGPRSVIDHRAIGQIHHDPVQFVHRHSTFKTALHSKGVPYERKVVQEVLDASGGRLQSSRGSALARDAANNPYDIFDLYDQETGQTISLIFDISYYFGRPDLNA